MNPRKIIFFSSSRVKFFVIWVDFYRQLLVPGNLLHLIPGIDLGSSVAGFQRYHEA